MPEYTDWFDSSFRSADDGENGRGKTPVVFDIIAPDRVTSLLPNDLKMVLHVNPSSMSINRSKVIERIQTLGGWVEQHWGDAPTEISLEASTGGFMRLYPGLVSSTGSGTAGAKVAPGSMKPIEDQKSSGRRETIAYDKYLDMLALFHNNGQIYDNDGNVILHGQVKMIFEGHTFYGWFSSFSVSETSDQPYAFELSANFTVQRESHKLYSFSSVASDFLYEGADPEEEEWWE